MSSCKAPAVLPSLIWEVGNWVQAGAPGGKLTNKAKEVQGFNEVTPAVSCEWTGPASQGHSRTRQGALTAQDYPLRGRRPQWPRSLLVRNRRGARHGDAARAPCFPCKTSQAPSERGPSLCSLSLSLCLCPCVSLPPSLSAAPLLTPFWGMGARG